MRGVSDRIPEEREKSVGEISTTGGNVEHAGKFAFVIEHRGTHAAHRGVAIEEMLGAVNCHGALFHQASADPIGALARLAPIRASP